MSILTIIDEKINYNKNAIRGLEIETRKLKGQKKQAGKIGIEKWLGNIFESSSGLTPEFSSFSRDFKKHLKSIAGIDYELYFSRGHFYMSGFFRNKRNDKFAYFSSSDVRYSPDNWFNNILVREAKGEKDYTGGSNNFCKLPELRENIERLTA